jgi:signal transduction histidine kinase
MSSLQVSDYGEGIAPGKKHELEASGTVGAGIRGIRERIRQLDGSLELDSNGRGTVLRLRLPTGGNSAMAAD